MKHIKNTIKGIIFDMDGTIIDTNIVWEKALHHMLKNRHIHVSNYEEHEVFTRMIGYELTQSIELLRETFDIQASSLEMAQETVRIARQLLVTEARFIEGFLDFHKKVREAGIPTSIATNCDPDSLADLTMHLEFPQYFGQNIYCIAHVENQAKPNPALFLHAADRIGAQPEKCVVFEDSEAGFKAAQRAGIACVGVKNQKNVDLIPHYTHASISTYHEAEDALKKLIREYWKIKEAENSN